jgi:hypothetical protein
MLPPAPSQSQSQAAQTAEEKKLENQKRAEILRAKLLAQRQNTPAKAHPPPSPAPAPSRPALPASDTPSKAPPGAATQSAQKPNNVPSHQDTQQGNEQQEQNLDDSSSDMNGLEALLAEGKAAADAKIAALAADEAARARSSPSPHTRIPQNGVGATHASLASRQPHQPPTKHPLPNRPTNLSDSYYADLAIWLELTGFHDVNFRNAKLRTYKERKSLEEEAARIQERLEKLRRDEQAEMQPWRMGTPVLATVMAPPPLPATLPPDDKTVPPPTNGVKRPRSSDSTQAEKNSRRREDNSGFRIRGANDSPEARSATTARRPRSPSPADRRIGYPPDSRRRSIDDRAARSRDSSLERRQSYYRRDGDAAATRDYDHYLPREPAARPGYATVTGVSRPTRATPQFRGATGGSSDPRKSSQFYSRPV